MEDIREYEIENYRKEIKILEELHNLMAEELDICNLVISMSMSDEDFYERKKEAYRIYLEQKEEEK